MSAYVEPKHQLPDGYVPPSASLYPPFVDCGHPECVSLNQLNECASNRQPPYGTPVDGQPSYVHAPGITGLLNTLGIEGHATIPADTASEPPADLQRGRDAPSGLVVFVPGKPAPQGSKRLLGTSGGKSIAVESSKAVAPWRADVRDELLKHHSGPALDGPLAVTLTFFLARPKSHYRTGRNAHLLRESAPELPAGRCGDVDKLARAVLDAVGSAGVWNDDSQVVNLSAAKNYTSPGVKPGAWITITPLEA